MKRYNRIFLIVLDSLGIGEMPDAYLYKDKGVDTLGHISKSVKGMNIPNLQRLGLANLHEIDNVNKVDNPIGIYTRLAEKSVGKDTMTGHWEMMGIETKAFCYVY